MNGSETGGEMIAITDLQESLGALPALLWRIEVARSRIEFLNWQAQPGLGLDVPQLLKNRDYRDRFIHPEDRTALDELMQKLRRGEGGTLLFRALGAGGRILWFKLSGRRSLQDDGFMAGHLLELSTVVDDIRRRTASASVPAPSQKAVPAQQLQQEMRGINRIDKVLQLLFESQSEPLFDAIIFSDIHVRKNQVVVYSCGVPLSSLPQGKVFPYEGTIAENILQFGLENLIVDDTHDSIKAIDWALFVPAGIRSYFAKPFYHGQKLHSVLILCATTPNRFAGTTVASFEGLYPPFLCGLKQWRQRNKVPA
jgi:hypothetical protein